MKDAKIEILKHLGFNPIFYSSEINNNKIDLDVFENMFILRQDKGINMFFNSVMNYSDEILNGMINISTNIEARNAFKKLCDMVFHGETLVISRPRNENVVMVSESEYNEMMKAKRNAESCHSVVAESPILEEE